MYSFFSQSFKGNLQIPWHFTVGMALLLLGHYSLLVPSDITPLEREKTPHYCHVGAEIQAPHLVSTESRGVGRPCVQQWGWKSQLPIRQGVQVHVIASKVWKSGLPTQVFAGWGRDGSQCSLWCLAGVGWLFTKRFCLSRLPLLLGRKSRLCWCFLPHQCPLVIPCLLCSSVLNLGCLRQNKDKNNKKQTGIHHYLIPWVPRSLASLPSPYFQSLLTFA